MKFKKGNTLVDISNNTIIYSGNGQEEPQSDQIIQLMYPRVYFIRERERITRFVIKDIKNGYNEDILVHYLYQKNFPNETKSLVHCSYYRNTLCVCTGESLIRITDDVNNGIVVRNSPILLDQRILVKKKHIYLWDYRQLFILDHNFETLSGRYFDYFWFTNAPRIFVIKKEIYIPYYHKLYVLGHNEKCERRILDSYGFYVFPTKIEPFYLTAAGTKLQGLNSGRTIELTNALPNVIPRETNSYQVGNKLMINMPNNLFSSIDLFKYRLGDFGYFPKNLKKKIIFLKWILDKFVPKEVSIFIIEYTISE